MLVTTKRFERHVHSLGVDVDKLEELVFVLMGSIDTLEDKVLDLQTLLLSQLRTQGVKPNIMS